MNFPLPNTAYVYRSLKLAEPKQAGWDVYALQTALEAVEFPNLTVDGAFGVQTRDAVLKFQQSRYEDEAEHDAIAGIGTQRKLMSVLCRRATKEWELPKGCPYGHCEKECGGQLGNHSARYPNGSWDIGMCQRNTQYIDALEDGFHAPESLEELCERIQINWEEYEALGNVDHRRAFELACGSWNAPAWTLTLARGGSLSRSARDWIEAYIQRVTSYVDLEDL